MRYKNARNLLCLPYYYSLLFALIGTERVRSAVTGHCGGGRRSSTRRLRQQALRSADDDARRDGNTVTSDP